MNYFCKRQAHCLDLPNLPAGPRGPGGPGGPAKKVSKTKQGRIHQMCQSKTVVAKYVTCPVLGPAIHLK